MVPTRRVSRLIAQPVGERPAFVLKQDSEYPGTEESEREGLAQLDDVASQASVDCDPPVEAPLRSQQFGCECDVDEASVGARHRHGDGSRSMHWPESSGGRGADDNGSGGGDATAETAATLRTLLRYATVRGCFRIRVVFMGVSIFVGVVAFFLFSQWERLFLEHTRSSGQAVCLSASVSMETQFRLVEEAVAGPMVAVASLTNAAVVGGWIGNATTVSSAPTMNSVGEQLCQSFFGGLVAAAAFNASTLAMLPRALRCPEWPSISHVFNATPVCGEVALDGARQLRCEMSRLHADSIQLTAMVNMRSIANGQSVASSLFWGALDAADAQDAVVISVHLSREVFGTALLGASKYPLNSAGLLRNTRMAVMIDDEVVASSLTATHATYTDDGGAADETYLTWLFAHVCNSGASHTWRTNARRWVDAGSAQTLGSGLERLTHLPVPYADDNVAVLCGVICDDVVYANRSSNNRGDNSRNTSSIAEADCYRRTHVVVVTDVQTDASRLVVSLVLYLALSTCVVAVVTTLLLYAAITVPSRVLNDNIIALLSGTPTKPSSFDRFVTNATRRFWINDMSALLRQFHIMALFFTANRKYVPNYVFQQQLDRLRDENDIQALLHSLNLREWGEGEEMFPHHGAVAEGAYGSFDNDEFERATQALLQEGPPGAEGGYQLRPQNICTTTTSTLIGGGQLSDATSIVPMASAFRGRLESSQLTPSSTHGMSYIESSTLLAVQLGAIEPAFVADFALTSRQHRKVFTAINAVIRRHKGEVFERTGERVSVAWNAFEARADHAVRAVRCATDIAALFRQFRRDGLRMGIVVHQGPVVCGIVGDHREAASVLFGQTAEHAVRLAVLAAQLPYFNVLATEPVKQAVSIFFECVIVDVVRDREIDAPLALFDVRQELTGAKRDSQGALARPPRGTSQSSFVVEYTTAFAHFRAHQFGEALARIASLSVAHPDDPLLTRLAALCVYYQAHDAQLPRPYNRPIPPWRLFEDEAEMGLADGPPTITLRPASPNDPASPDAGVNAGGSSNAWSPVGRSNGKKQHLELSLADVRSAAISHATQRRAQQAPDKASSFVEELRTSMQQSQTPHMGPQHRSGGPPSPFLPGGALPPALAGGGTADRSYEHANRDGGAATASQNPPAAASPSRPKQSNGSASPSDVAGTLIESVGWSIPMPTRGPTVAAPPQAATGCDSGSNIDGGALSPHSAPTQSTPSLHEQQPRPRRGGGAAATLCESLPTTIVDAQENVFVRSSRVLGAGSFGCVYLGMEQKSGRLVAMKFLPLPSDEAEVRVLQNEVVTMETVTDANLVEFYGYAFVDNMIVLMMECLVAGSLAGMLTTFAALPEQTTINFVRDVLRGLHRLHSMGIVHRDVKPQNVLIAANGHCKISDFGASASIHELVRRHDGGAEVQGTPIYLAPEAARGHAEPKSDVWSVGIMYLQLTTGSIPYDAGAMGAGIGAVVFGIGSGRLRPTIPEDLSPLARAFVEGCLADDAKQRRTAEQLLELPFFCVF